MGGGDFFSNGIHLNVIEAAEDPAPESWRNLQAIDDLVREVIETDSQLVDLGARRRRRRGRGAARARRRPRLAREDVVLNPYYRHMGGLYGSEYWTYLLPRRVGARHEPPGSPRRRSSRSGRAARSRSVCSTPPSAPPPTASAPTCADRRAARPQRRAAQLDDKRLTRARDERTSRSPPTAPTELARSHQCFFGPDRSYHEARHRFVHKLGASSAPTS